MPNKYTIIQDTKEKYPYDFSFFSDRYECTQGHLKTGDYTLEGYEDRICVERKRSTAEIATNLGKKMKQFEAEFQRMQEFEFRFLVCEFPWEYIECFPSKSTIPKRRWKWLRMNSSIIAMQLNRLISEYDVTAYFCNDRAEAETKTIEIFDEVLDVIHPY